MSKVTRFESLKIRDVTEILSGHRSDPVIKPNPFFDNHEKIIYAEDQTINFKAFVAIHNTNRGYALGGCRYWSRYEVVDNDGGVNNAASDALRLSKGMTYKNSVADLPLGGGKTVIIGKPGTKSPTAEMMRALGAVIDSLEGQYVTAEDVGTNVELMLIASGRTPYVAGLPLAVIAGQDVPETISHKDIPEADPSPYTAYGTYVGIKAAAKFALSKDNLKGLRITIKGYGNVSSTLCDYLYSEGAKLFITDIDQSKRDIVEQKYGNGSWISDHSKIMAVPADIYVPAALGADINDQTIEILVSAGVSIVAGCANNQLAEHKHGKLLLDKGICYAPDYVINSGGVIAAGLQYDWTRDRSQRFPTHQVIKMRVDAIYHTLLKIFTMAEDQSIPTSDIADFIAHEGFIRDDCHGDRPVRKVGT
jgi:leucine dehydrogenase